MPNRTLGPWEKHRHTYNCECATYPASSGFRGVWYFRPDIEGNEIIYAFSEEDKETADEKALDEGYNLVDSPGWIGVDMADGRQQA